MNKKTRLILVIVIILVLPVMLIAKELTISDIVSAQQENSSAIETIKAEVENEVENGGKKQMLIYDYILQNNPDGSKKMMVTSKGVFTMQFLVDTKEGSVTYLMADGSTKKFTLTPDELEKISAQFAINNLQGRINNLQFAGLNNTAKDGRYKTTLDTDMLETKENIIKVDRKKSSKEYAYVEWHDKKAKDIEKQIEDKIRKAEAEAATKDGAKKMKTAFIAEMKKNKEKAIKTTMAKRIEKINMKTGVVEETEFYNVKGDKIGWTKIKQMANIECRMPSAKWKMADGKSKDKKNSTNTGRDGNRDGRGKREK